MADACWRQRFAPVLPDPRQCDGDAVRGLCVYSRRALLGEASDLRSLGSARVEYPAAVIDRAGVFALRQARELARALLELLQAREARCSGKALGGERGDAVRFSGHDGSASAPAFGGLVFGV